MEAELLEDSHILMRPARYEAIPQSWVRNLYMFLKISIKLMVKWSG